MGYYLFADPGDERLSGLVGWPVVDS